VPAFWRYITYQRWINISKLVTNLIIDSPSELLFYTMTEKPTGTGISKYCIYLINIVTIHLSSQPIQRFVARQQLRKYATIMQALLGGHSRVTMEIQLEEVFSMWSALTLYHANYQLSETVLDSYRWQAAAEDY
jgi:hypothetical protein